MPARDLSGEMLDAVIATMLKYRRPRKNPGMGRPVAVTADNKVLEKVTLRHIPAITRLSLPGAFRYVEITGKYGKHTAGTAKRAFYGQYNPNGANLSGIDAVDVEIAKIDQETSDSRLLLRSLRAARKKIRKNALRPAP